MSSDYYGSIAGEIADEGARAEAAFLEWVNEYTRSEPHATIHDELRAAFMAGADLTFSGNSLAAHSFTRDQLIEAISHLEVEVTTRTRPAAFMVSAESMADGIIEALEAGSDE